MTFLDAFRRKLARYHDGLMSVFGIDDQPDAPLRAVNAGLETLGVVNRLQPFFASMYDIEFDVRIGVHYGEAVVGSVGAIGHERVTVIGDVVNGVAEAVIKFPLDSDAMRALLTKRILTIGLQTSKQDLEYSFGKKGSKKMQATLACIQ